MSKTNNNNSNTIPVHLEDDILIAYLDGELSEEEKNSTIQHLGNCWACRGNLKLIQDSIDNFMNQRQQILIPRDLPPSEPAVKLFNERLQNYVSKNQSTSVFSLFSSKSRNLLSRARAEFYSFTSSTRVVPVRIGAALLAVTVIAALLLTQTAVPTVSANELLRNTEAAVKNSISSSPEPVIHRKLQVRRTKNNGQVDSVHLETWEDPRRKNYREAVEIEGIRQLVVDRFEGRLINAPHIFENQRPVLLTDLYQILELNRMNPQDPLSAVSFKAWRDSLGQKNEVVNSVTSEDNLKNYELKVTPLGELNRGQITEASYSVRASGWTPQSLKLEVKDADGTVNFEITQSSAQVVALSQLSSEIFPQTTGIAKVSVAPVTPKESPSASPSPETEPAANSTALTKDPAENKMKNLPATADLEVEVLRLLNQAQADLGEQITVRRERDGPLYVRGIVETPQRKKEILDSLEAVKNNPAVRLEINTVAEAVAKEKNKPQSPERVESVETQSTTIAAENDLIERFGSQEAARSFAGQTVNLSGRAMQRAYALKRLAGQFKPEDLRKMSPEARAKWLTLIRQHAAAFQQETRNLRGKLKQAFDEPNVSPSATMNVSDIADVPRAVEQLLGLASTNDRAVSSAMMISTGDTQFTVIKTAQFWQSLKTAEALAAKLQGVK